LPGTWCRVGRVEDQQADRLVEGEEQVVGEDVAAVAVVEGDPIGVVRGQQREPPSAKDGRNEQYSLIGLH
jgi:hypothetical protein